MASTDETKITLDNNLLERIREDTQLDVFESPAQFAKEADRLTPERSKYRRDHDGGWYGETWEKVVARSLSGDETSVPKAQQILSKVEQTGLLSSGVVGYRSDVIGYFPNVAAYINGDPENMWGPRIDRSHRTPVRIYVDVAVASGIEHKELVSRGTAILALAMAMSARRPVELYAYAGLDASPIRKVNGYSGKGFRSAVVKIETAPLDLASACFALTSPAYYRRLHMAWAEQSGFVGTWAYNVFPDDKRRVPVMRLALGLEPDDVLVNAGAYGDGELMTTDPVKWLIRELEKSNTIEQAA